MVVEQITVIQRGFLAGSQFKIVADAAVGAFQRHLEPVEQIRGGGNLHLRK
ncbi:hypothetical protein SDC9_88577 [bioreactor metagenome]|uniref:Uncharacterized protein n=1 Tax=bioreactor metagenome TaxID=1076179 RepID=A0A644ZMG4_9ZZZZ